MWDIPSTPEEKKKKKESDSKLFYWKEKSPQTLTIGCMCGPRHFAILNLAILEVECSSIRSRAQSAQ